MNYSPFKIADYYKARFWTQNNSLYVLDGSGILIKASRETNMIGSRVVLIAGLDDEGEYELQRRKRTITQTKSRSNQELLSKKGFIDQLILEAGKEPQTGLYLIMSVSDKDAIKKMSIGISTSKLSYIEKA